MQQKMFRVSLSCSFIAGEPPELRTKFEKIYQAAGKYFLRSTCANNAAAFSSLFLVLGF
jgi:hypothetical protein